MKEMETKVDIPKTLEQELQQLIDATRFVMENSHTKSDPMRALWREGKLTYEFVSNEIEPVLRKTSKLSSGKRAAIEALFRTAVKQFEKRTQDVKNNK